MEIRFEPIGPDDDQDLSALHTWLLDERKLRRRVEVEALGERPGEMSVALDAVLAVVSTAAALGQLAVAVAAWRDARKPRTTVRVVVSGTVSGGEPGEVRDALRILGCAEEGE